VKKLVKLAVASAVVFGVSSAMAVEYPTDPDERTDKVVQIYLTDEAGFLVCTVLDKDSDELIRKEVAIDNDKVYAGYYLNTLKNEMVVWCKALDLDGTKKRAEKYNAESEEVITLAGVTNNGDTYCKTDIKEILENEGIDDGALEPLHKARTGIWKNVITPSGKSILTCTYSLGLEPGEVNEDEE